MLTTTTILLCTLAMSWARDITKFQSSDIPCNQQTIDQLDEVVLTAAILGDQELKYPSSEKETQAHCRNDRIRISWAKNYTKKCMGKKSGTETSHHVTRLLVFSMEKVMKKRCRTEKTREVFINAGKCGNKNAVKTETTQCWNQYIKDYQQINKAKFAKIKNERHLIPLICCKYHKFRDCFIDVYSDPKYSQVCTDKASVELEGYINESMYDVLQYLCGDYQEYSDKCDNLVNKYKDVWSSVKVSSPPKSPLSDANEVFDSIPPI